MIGFGENDYIGEFEVNDYIAIITRNGNIAIPVNGKLFFQSKSLQLEIPISLIKI